MDGLGLFIEEYKTINPYCDKFCEAIGKQITQNELMAELKKKTVVLLPLKCTNENTKQKWYRKTCKITELAASTNIFFSFRPTFNFVKTVKN